MLLSNSSACESFNLSLVLEPEIFSYTPDADDQSDGGVILGNEDVEEAQLPESN